LFSKSAAAGRLLAAYWLVVVYTAAARWWRTHGKSRGGTVLYYDLSLYSELGDALLARH